MKTRRTLERIDIDLAEVTAAIDALLAASAPKVSVLDLMGQGYSLADATKAAISGNRDLPRINEDEWERLRKRHDKLWKERQALKPRLTTARFPV
jgi:hypothetical protein